MIVTMRTVFITLVKCGIRCVFSESLFALFADKGNFSQFQKFVAICGCFVVAFRAIKPSLTAWCTHRYLSIENVFAEVRCVVWIMSLLTTLFLWLLIYERVG